MGFTDNCDIYVSFHEDGFNGIINHIRRQRPSLFNYATAYVAQHPGLLCKAIGHHAIVTVRGNPLVTIVDPLPIPGTSYGVNFAAQLAELRIDFHPGDEFALPPELSPPLAAQRLAIKLTICGGIGCPPNDSVDNYLLSQEDPVIMTRAPEPKVARSRGGVPVTVSTGAYAAGQAVTPQGTVRSFSVTPLPTNQLNCFCLDAFAVGGMRVAAHSGQFYLEPFIDGIEIVDLKPDGLENSLECYIGLMLKLAILPGLRILLKDVPLSLMQGGTDLFPQSTNVVLSLIPVSAALPNNPAIEQDQLKAFIKAEVI